MKDIEFDFAKAYRVKERLEQMVFQLQTEVLDEMEEMLENYSGDHCGMAQKQFGMLMSEEILKLKESKGELSCAKEELLNVIEETRKREERAKELARLRKY